MPLRRSISWSAASSHMRADRIDAVAAEAYRASVHAAKMEALRARAGAKLWTAAGGFDRRAIMADAVAYARCLRGSWQERMAEALTLIWACAHAARRAGSH